jgi:ketosteroid isomerase-like protein
MSQENVEAIRSLTERINAGDIDGILELIHPDVVVYAPEDEPEGGIYRGHEGWRQTARSWYDSFDDYHVETEELIDAGEYVVAVGLVTATGHSSGARVEDRAVWLWRFRDGLGIECREFHTKGEALEAAGLRE